MSKRDPKKSFRFTVESRADGEYLCINKVKIKLEPVEDKEPLQAWFERVLPVSRPARLLQRNRSHIAIFSCASCDHSFEVCMHPDATNIITIEDRKGPIPNACPLPQFNITVERNPQ